MKNKILVAVTSIAKYPTLDRATGLWLSEAVDFVKKMQEAGYQVDYVSPQGGYTAIDPQSLTNADATSWQWYQNKPFMNLLGATLKPEQIKAEDYSSIYFTGGHGVLWDFPDNTTLQNISRMIYENSGYVAAVCHGVCALLNVTLPDGKPLVEGKKVTGFSNAEEKLSGMEKVVPFSTETALGKKGALYQKAAQPWAPFAVQDGRLITGQNPASGGAVADLLIKSLKPVAVAS